ncbi:MAG TPA: hypothetical protein VKQ05_12080 [Gemmatimonadales bacterium]|nr:hypothetical protein [Gemmatimonadales bacterium]
MSAQPKSQPMPLERAILWNPPAAAGAATNPGKEKSSSRTPYPIFFQQEAVIALQDHIKSSPTQAIFGFLIGDIYRDPDAGALYTVIDKTLKLSQPIYGDKTEVVVSRLWERMQEQLSKASATLLGWYHSHPGQGGYLTQHDVETHEKFFTEPWHVAVLVAAEAGGVTGRFFRATPGNADWHKTPLPFHELLQPESIKPDGKKRSYIMWRNYKPYGPTLTGPKPKPKEPEPEPEPPPPAPPPPPPPKAEEPQKKTEKRGFRIMRSSADDIPVIKTSADDEPAPAPPEPVPPPPVIVPDEPAPPPPAKSTHIPWQVSPQEVSAPPLPLMPISAQPPAPAAPPPAPPPPPPPPPPLAPPPRRTSAPKFRLLEEETERERARPAPPPRPKRRKRRGPWPKRLVTLLVILGLGAGGYWYAGIRHPQILSGLLDRGKQLVSRFRSSKPPARSPARRTSAPPPLPGPQAAPTTPAAFARFDRLSDSLARSVRNFKDQVALFSSGRMDCSGLSAGLVVVENLWNSYSIERRERMASFDQRRAAQDQAMYAAVDSVESGYEHSSCPRP